MDGKDANGDTKRTDVDNLASLDNQPNLPKKLPKITVIASIVLVVLLSVVVVGYGVFRHKNTDQDESGTAQQNQARESAEKPVTWSFDTRSNAWEASSQPPPCVEPFVFDQSPVDVSKVTSVLYPGQTRGGNYKAHGGFAFDNQTDNLVTVTMPYDAYLVGGARYYESGELQYIFDFTAECGIAIRFDHLATVSERLQKIADASLPQPEPNNSRGAFIEPPVLFKAGEVIATAVGFSNKLNVGLDFGVYDYRASNAASKNPEFQKNHSDFSATTYYGVCWFDMLAAPDADTIKALPSRDQSMGKTSDYCQ